MLQFVDCYSCWFEVESRNNYRAAFLFHFRKNCSKEFCPFSNCSISCGYIEFWSNEAAVSGEIGKPPFSVMDFLLYWK